MLTRTGHECMRDFRIQLPNVFTDGNAKKKDSSRRRELRGAKNLEKAASFPSFSRTLEHSRYSLSLSRNVRNFLKEQPPYPHFNNDALPPFRTVPRRQSTGPLLRASYFSLPPAPRPPHRDLRVHPQHGAGLGTEAGREFCDDAFSSLSLSVACSRSHHRRRRRRRRCRRKSGGKKYAGTQTQPPTTSLSMGAHHRAKKLPQLHRFTPDVIPRTHNWVIDRVASEGNDKRRAARGKSQGDPSESRKNSGQAIPVRTRAENASDIYTLYVRIMYVLHNVSCHFFFWQGTVFALPFFFTFVQLRCHLCHSVFDHSEHTSTTVNDGLK